MMIKFTNIYRRFFKISIFTFGGGYAMLPMVEQELVKRDGLLTHDNVIDDYAMGQTIPGAIGVNTSALIGYRIKGRKGALTAVAGFITPSIIIISLVSILLVNIENLEIVEKIFTSLRAGVVALMLNSLLNIAKKTLKDVFAYILFIVGFVSVAFLGMHPIILILTGGLAGYLYYKKLKEINS